VPTPVKHPVLPDQRLAGLAQPARRPAHARYPPRLDAVGILLSPGITAALFGLTQLGGTTGFASAKVALPLCAGVALLIGYTAWALRPGAGALLDIRLLRHRSLAGSTILLLLAGAALYGTMLMMPLLLAAGPRRNRPRCGAASHPAGCGHPALPLAGRRFMDRLGAHSVAVLAFAVTFAATMPFGFLTAATSNVMLTAVLFVRGLGLGAAMIALMGGAFVGLTREEIPAASSISRVAQQVGGSIGTAVLVVILQRAVAGTRAPAALASGFGDAFWWAAASTAAAVPLCLLLPGKTADAPDTLDTTTAEQMVDA
jgi:hypothetical protein